MLLLFGVLFFAWIGLSLVWLSTFAQAGRIPWAKRGYRYRRVRWTTAIAATASFVLAGVVGQQLPPPGKPAVAAAPAVGAREAGAAPEASAAPADAATSSTVDIAPEAQEADLAQPITEGQVTSGTTALCAAIFEAVGEAARTGKVDPDKTITQVKMLLTADATLTKELSISDARAQKILGVSIRRMEDQDPDGNVAEYCMNHR